MIDRETLERLDDARLATWDTHRPDDFVDFFANDFVIRDTAIAAPITTRDGAREYLRSWLAAFPDLRIRRTNRVVDDESVAGEVEMIGTNTGPIELGSKRVSPTGKAIVGHGADFARVRDGKFVELSTHPDLAGIMEQLGLTP